MYSLAYLEIHTQKVLIIVIVSKKNYTTKYLNYYKSVKLLVIKIPFLSYEKKLFYHYGIVF